MATVEFCRLSSTLVSERFFLIVKDREMKEGTFTATLVGSALLFQSPLCAVHFPR